VSVLVSPSVSGVHQPVDCRARYWGARWGAAHDHLKRSVPEQLCYCGRSTRTTTSLLAKVCRLQCQVYPRSPPFRARLKTNPAIPAALPRCVPKKTGSIPLRLRPNAAVEFRSIFSLSMPTRKIKEESRLLAIPVAGCPIRRGGSPNTGPPARKHRSQLIPAVAV
jgi:hypothetical protein